MLESVTKGGRTKGQTDPVADAAISWLSNYEPAATDPDQIWPPSIRCESWNNQTLPHSIHYSQEDAKAILGIVYGNALNTGEILVTDFRNGLPCLLWGRVFPKVVSILSHKFPDHEPIVDSNQTILFGKPADTRFLYEAVKHVSNLKVVLLDDLYYGNIISLYFMFRRLIKPPGAVIFMNTAQRVPEHAGVHRFLKDLSAGALDNTRHRLVHLHNDPKGYGISYEMVT